MIIMRYLLCVGRIQQNDFGTLRQHVIALLENRKNSDILEYDIKMADNIDI